MRLLLVWNDGRTEDQGEYQGGIKFIKMWQRNGRYFQTTFERAEVFGDTVNMHEGETKDKTADMHRAEQENRERTMNYLRRGWASSDCEVPACKCPCHATQRHGEDK